MEIQVGNLKINLADEAINTRLNIDTLLTLLVNKRIITQEEFNEIKTQLIEQFKREHPELFRESPPCQT